MERIAGIFQIIMILSLPAGAAYSQEEALRPGSIFREYHYNKMISPYVGVRAWKDSFYVDLNVDDLRDAAGAEVAIKYWSGHIGTSDQTFRVNQSKKYPFPQPETPGNPYCYYRTVIGNPPVTIPVGDLKEGQNRFTFFCGPQVCYGYNWPHYWLYAFTLRVFYNDSKNCARGMIKKGRETDTAFNWIGFDTETDHPDMVESVEYIGYYADYDLDGDGRLSGWHYIIDDGKWAGIIGRQYLPPYHANWNNFWVPQQAGPIKVIAKINSKNGLSYLSRPVIYNHLIQKGSRVKIYNTLSLGENFGSRIGRRMECSIRIGDDISKALSAYIILSSWSGESEDGKVHMMGINGKMLADCPGKLHDWALLRLPVPLEWLKQGENIFFIYSETDGHAFEVNVPGPSILVRFPSEE
jgi:hypothetical protein